MTTHMSVHKNYLIRILQADGDKAVGLCLKDFDGTAAEAIAALEADPRTYFVSCGSENPDGSCAGHPPKERA